MEKIDLTVQCLSLPWCVAELYECFSGAWARTYQDSFIIEDCCAYLLAGHEHEFQMWHLIFKHCRPGNLNWMFCPSRNEGTVVCVLLGLHNLINQVGNEKMELRELL